MKRLVPPCRPGSKSLGRALVDRADFLDLIKRIECVQGLISRAKDEADAIRRAMAGADRGQARRLELDLAAKCRFLASLEKRMEELQAQYAKQELAPALILEMIP